MKTSSWLVVSALCFVAVGLLSTTVWAQACGAGKGAKEGKCTVAAGQAAVADAAVVQKCSVKAAKCEAVKAKACGAADKACTVDKAKACTAEQVKACAAAGQAKGECAQAKACPKVEAAPAAAK